MPETDDRELITDGMIETAAEETAMVPGTDFIPADPDAYLARIEVGLDFINKLHMIITKMMNPLTDLVALGTGNKQVISLTKRGYYKIVNLIGGQITYPRDAQGFPLVKKNEGQDEQGKWYGYEAFATFTRADGRVFEGSAMITSRHKFFGKVSTWENKGGRNVKTGTKLKDLADIEEQDVRTAALTYAEKSAVRKGVGLTSFTIEELENAGVDVKKIPGYKFESKSGYGQGGGSRGSQGGTQKKQGQKKEPKKEPAQKPKNEPAPEDPPTEAKPTDPINGERRTAIMLAQKKNNITDDEMKKILGELGFEKLSEVRNQDLESLRQAMKDMALSKLK